MNRVIEDILRSRRSYYELNKDISVSKACIEKLVRETVLHVPSAFNSQSTRLVLLLGDSHERFWKTVCEKIADKVSPDVFEKSKNKIERAFANGYGTVLFYEEERIIEQLQKDNPLYADDIPIYSEQTSAMHQIVLWLLFESVGVGASLQHYNSLIEHDVKKMFSLPDTWHLVAQMPFGNPVNVPNDKFFLPIEERIKILC